VTGKLLRYSPQESTHKIRVQSLPVQWTELDPCMGGKGFLSSWLEDGRDEVLSQCINWRSISGMGFALVMGAAFWAGLGLLISRIV
jgi:hypothetical protein